MIAEKLVQKPKYTRPHPGNPKTLTAPRYKKGQTGNPGGKRKDGLKSQPKVYLVSDALKELLEDKRISRELAQALFDVARDPAHPLMIRAAEVMLDRTEGKVEQKVKHDGVVKTARLEVVGATPEELKAIQEFAGASHPVLEVEAEVVEPEAPSGS